MTISEFSARLAGVKGSGGQITARCPAHDDRHQSLSVREGDGGRILVKCHAGCAIGERTDRQCGQYARAGECAGHSQFTQHQQKYKACE